MINLPILKTNDRKILYDIIYSKHTTAKTLMLNKYDKILEDYLKYYKNRHNLELLTRDEEIDEELAKCLNASYKSGKVIDSIKANIMDLMPAAIKEKCPYCMLSEPGTFDHYLGKGRFPEYSVLSKNIVPCCSKCNSKKGEKFLTVNGNRAFISYYFDELPQNTFLKVELGVEYGVIYIKNMFIACENQGDIDEIINSHFRELDLFERYKNPMTNKVSLLISTIKGSKQNKLEIIDFIRKEIIALKKIYGSNYWESCLYEGIINNSDALEVLEHISFSCED